ncbi:MAG: hypothetical protein H6Q73_1467 [Firmicutes bacterium]|nr:hypothetical protein [Bacillota bacterium]
MWKLIPDMASNFPEIILMSTDEKEPSSCDGSF